MNDSIIASIDSEIVRLQQARLLLAGGPAAPGALEAPRRGRPKSKKIATKAATVTSTPARAERTMSAEAKARIAVAQKKRWALRKRTAKNVAAV